MKKRKIVAKILRFAAGMFCLVGLVDAIFFKAHIEWGILAAILAFLSIWFYQRQKKEIEVNKINQKDNFYENIILNRRGNHGN